MSTPQRLKLAGIGCGGRVRTYFELAARMPHWYEIVAAADPQPSRLELARRASGNPGLLCFRSDRELLSQPKLADVMIIGTQDDYHVEPCLAAMEKGYDVLLEKPIACNLRDVLMLERRARALGRKVVICHVLRYTPLYGTIKELIVSGVVGDVVAVHASEGVGAWHQAHSFVRGHWAVTEKATPMIVAKSCHDMDILAWLIDQPCKCVASFGELRYFTAANAPTGAPLRCTDGCPVGDACMYNALRYLDTQKGWLQWVFDGWATASDAEITAWLAQSPWGRCVYHCDNTAVDRQVVALEFERGITATFTMTAFDEGRNIIVMGTKGVLRGGRATRLGEGCDIIVEEHATGQRTRHMARAFAGGYDSHEDGDPGLMYALYDEMTKVDAAQMRSSISRSVESHVIAFAAEEARLTGTVINVQEFRARHQVE
ncbi:MAG: Gfo/Idh/MocA family oxidoreductase [bacterium]|nr:Gfo/Idh/MocA family oxidoreductase [bacterium]